MRSNEDKSGLGSHVAATNEQMCNKVRDLVYCDRRIQVKEIAKTLSIL